MPLFEASDENQFNPLLKQVPTYHPPKPELRTPGIAGVGWSYAKFRSLRIVTEGKRGP